MTNKTHRFGIIFPIICLAFFSVGTLSFFKAQENQKVQPWEGSRTTAVHLIQLKDEFDQLIIPSETYPLPYSTRYTCAPCHDYSIIQAGLHFDASPSSRAGRSGEPWFWVDPKTGTVLPLSYQGWEGMWNPQDLGLTAWDFTMLFGRHMTGGGISEPEDGETSPESRWNVSGRLEINCMGCHNASRVQSHSEWAKQVLRHNFRWAAAAASGLGEVGGMASRLPGTWDLYDGPNPDDTEWAIVPFVKYRSERFDSKHRVFFDIAPKIDDQRCLACHSVSRVDEKKYTAEEDVHSAAGLKCVDCHRNDVSHNMIRGYEGEAEEFQEPERTDFTCQGCHMGKELSQRGGPTRGRLGAPYPQHSGIPVVHFERLSCTVCHAGSLPSKDISHVRTSRANRLGIYGIAQWSTEWPHIVEPVSVKNNRGKLSPHRMMWPAFWGRLEGEQILPLKPLEVEDAAGDILTVEQDVAEILKAIALYAGIEGVPVLILSGNAYEPNVDGLLDVSPYDTEKSESDILWAVKTEGEINPLIPAFNPDAEEPDVDVESRIQIVLEALATLGERPGKPALIFKKAMYRMTEGYLEKLESPKEPIEIPEFVWLKGEEIVPIVSGFQVRTLIETVGYEQSLTEEQVELVLKVLSQKEMKQESMGNYAYISGGKMFRLDDEGRLSASSHLASEPIAWPLGHRVRPAQQSMGINGCTDCHSEGSSFFFGQIRGSGPLKTERIEKRSAHSFMDLDKPYQKLFGLSFRMRPIFKIVLFVASAIVGSILLLMFLLILGRYTGLLEKRR